MSCHVHYLIITCTVPSLLGDLSLLARESGIPTIIINPGQVDVLGSANG